MGVNMGSEFKKDARVKGKDGTEFAGRYGTIIDMVRQTIENKTKIIVIPQKWRIRFDGDKRIFEVEEDKIVICD
jgi:hypothetical protein